MENGLEQLITHIWMSALEKMMKKDTSSLRPSLGDLIDLYVPQVRNISILEAKPTLAKIIYENAYNSSFQNTFNIMKKLGMPADYFWKYEYWPRERAFETLRKVINRVFSTMMNRHKEGELDLVSIEMEPIRFTINFKDCAECADIKTNAKICFYHTATFAGILGSLLNRDMAAYETSCHAHEEEICTFIIGKRDDPEIQKEVESYLNNTKIEVNLDNRLIRCLQGEQNRTMGNLVDIRYFNLIYLTSVLTDPAISCQQNLNTGTEYGKKIAPLLCSFYKENTIDVLKKYYNHLHHLEVNSIENTDKEINVRIQDCADTSFSYRQETACFLIGELQGLLSYFTSKVIRYNKSILDGNNLLINYSLDT